MDVKLPNGTVIQNVPDGITQTELLSMLDKNGVEHGAEPAPKAAPETKDPSSLVDAARSIPGGIAKGVAGLVGLPGDVSNLLDRGADYITGGNVSAHRVPGRIDSQQVNDIISAPTGGYYQPQTTAGKYAETIASFAPAAVMPGSAAARAARVVIPGLASETAGEATQGTELEPYARVAGAVAGGVAAGPTIRSINALTSRVGVPLENPNVAAGSMMADAVRRDGGAASVNDNLNNWRGNSAPALIDVTGNNVRRLVRSAASGGRGEAQNVATTYADRVAGNLQDNSLALTRGLTPGIDDSAVAVADQLEAAQGQDAQFNYRGPYSQPAAVTREMVSALQGPEGRSAISRAYAAARANRNVQQMGELQDLQGVASEQGGGADPITGQRRSLQQALEGVSAGSLDRVRIAMRETGGNLAARGARDMARGYRGRVNDIDTALDQTPGLQDARASYAGFARRQDALELGQTGLNASPENYGATIANLAQTPGAQQIAGVGYRQALTDAISRPTEGATGVLNRIGNSTAQTRNLAATFGDNAAQNYQTGINNEASRVRNARFISPNTGSQTELRLQDTGLMDVPTSAVGIVGRIWDHIKSSAQLTEQERTALVRMGTTEARLRDFARANPRLTSRALTAALLGNQSGRH